MIVSVAPLIGVWGVTEWTLEHLYGIIGGVLDIVKVWV
jgi:hypothetical protein